MQAWSSPWMSERINNPESPKLKYGLFLIENEACARHRRQDDTSLHCAHNFAQGIGNMSCSHIAKLDKYGRHNYRRLKDANFCRTSCPSTGRRNRSKNAQKVQLIDNAACLPICGIHSWNPTSSASQTRALRIVPFLPFFFFLLF